MYTFTIDEQMDAVELAAFGDVQRGSLNDIINKQKIEIDGKPKEETPKKPRDRKPHQETTNLPSSPVPTSVQVKTETTEPKKTA